MGDNGEGGRSAGGSPAGAGPHPVSADQSSPVRDIITTKWGVASSQIWLYKHLYPDPAFCANVTCKISYIQYWHPASGHSSGWNVTANFPDCIGSRSSVAVLSWSRDTSVNYQAPSFYTGSGNLNPSSSFRKRDEEWLGGRNWWKLFATYLTNWRAPQHLAYASSWTLPASWIRGIRIWHLGSYRRHEAIIGKS